MRAKETPDRDILVVNAGSSSLKLRVIAADDTVVRRADLEPGDDDGLATFIRSGHPPAAVAHRIVHGGPELRDSVRINPDVLRKLRDIADLAPLHNAAALATVAAVERLLPDAPAIACFDTAFHSRLPTPSRSIPSP